MLLLLDEDLVSNNLERQINQTLIIQFDIFRHELENQFHNESLFTTIADEIKRIEFSLDEIKFFVNNPELKLLKRIELIYKKIDVILSEIELFQKKYYEPIPSKFIQDLQDVLKTIKYKLDLIEDFFKNEGSISLLEITELNEENVLELMAKSCEVLVDIVDLVLTDIPLEYLDKLTEMTEKVFDLVSKKKSYETNKNEYIRRIRNSSYFLLSLLKKKQEALVDEAKILLQNSDEHLIMQDFMIISESALDEYWLDPEEDEAWKNL
jgi:hypothetical protein